MNLQVGKAHTSLPVTRLMRTKAFIKSRDGRKRVEM
jgi:hypothetical protein